MPMAMSILCIFVLVWYITQYIASFQWILIIISDEYRVKVLKNYQGDMSYGSYLLKVYNDEIKLFTPNGLIPTKFKCVLGDIFRVKHHIFGELHDCVTISIKNAVTK